ncbi:MAG: F0F1 ATP synthase subunit A [Thermomicrobiales bacterium]|nr:F0F1 ATP synthase subunit A [Thermomicrobiales bacterium]
MQPPHIELGAETLFKIGPIPITNSFFMMIIVMTALLIVFRIASRRITTDPSKAGRFGSAIELIIEFLLNLVETTGGKKLGRSIFPLISGLFIFIIVSNFTGLLPGVGSIYVDKTPDAVHEDADTHATDTDEHAIATAAVAGSTDEHTGATAGDEALEIVATEHVADEDGHHEVHVPIMRPPTADLNMTLAMSTIAFCAVQFFGVRAHGVGGRLKHMANPPFIFPIEVISEFSRIISLAARLFGNVFAGEVLLGVAYAIANSVKIAVVPLLFPVVFLGLETLFGTIQALVFSLLTLIYITLAAAHGHDDHDEAHAHDAHGEAASSAATGD